MELVEDVRDTIDALLYHLTSRFSCLLLKLTGEIFPKFVISGLKLAGIFIIEFEEKSSVSMKGFNSRLFNLHGAR